MDKMTGKTHKIYIEIMRRMTPEQKLLKVFELAATGRELFYQGLRKLHPDSSPEELKRIYMKNIEKCYNRNY
jgi:hypothetical protein